MVANITFNEILPYLPLIWIGTGILAYIIGIIGMVITKKMKGMAWEAVPVGIFLFMMMGGLSFVALIISMCKSKVKNDNQ